MSEAKSVAPTLVDAWFVNPEVADDAIGQDGTLGRPFIVALDPRHPPPRVPVRVYALFRGGSAGTPVIARLLDESGYQLDDAKLLSPVVSPPDAQWSAIATMEFRPRAPGRYVVTIAVDTAVVKTLEVQTVWDTDDRPH